MTKRFLPGTLNPLYENDSDFDIDLNEFNNPYYVNELQKKILSIRLGPFASAVDFTYKIFE